MKSKDFLKEGFVEDAASSHKDHEVQMARKDCYYAAEHALAIHKLLKHVSETQGIEGWVASKITLASDYLNTVREYLEYEMMSPPEPEGMSADVNVRLPIAEGRVKQLMMDLEELKPAEFKKKYNKTKEEVKKELTPAAKSDYNFKQGVGEGMRGTVSFPDDEGAHTGNNPSVSIGGTFAARPKVKQGSLVKASGLNGVWRINDIRGDQANITQEIPNSSKSYSGIPVSDLRVWTNKPVKEQGVDEAQGDNPTIGVDQITGKEKLRPHTGAGPKPGTIKHTLGKMAHTAKATMDYARGKPDRMGHLEEMTAVSAMATVNNPESKKPKSQVGSLFGGSYGEQKVSKNKKVIKR